MKKIVLILLVACLSITFLPMKLIASPKTTPTTLVDSKTAESNEVKTLKLRLNEINAMDKSLLKSTEKKALRKEVRSIKHQLSDIGGGVYLSAAAIVLIILLVVLLA
jgi:hypothetical protein